MNNFNIISYLANFKEGESGTFPPIPKPIPPEDNKFYIQDVSGMTNQVKMKYGGSGNVPNPTIEYSYDGKIWNEWVDYRNNTLDIQPKSKLYLRGGNDSFNSFNKQCSYNSFWVMHPYVVGGDITCLLRPEGGVLDLSDKSGCFNHLFYAQSNLKDASKLILPSTKLGFSCYHSMFEGASGFEVAPELPASKMSIRSYEFMFMDCRKLKYIKVGATNWSEEDAYNWVLNVSASGQFIKPKDTTIPSGVNGIPVDWRVVNK